MLVNIKLFYNRDVHFDASLFTFATFVIEDDLLTQEADFLHLSRLVVTFKSEDA